MDPEINIIFDKGHIEEYRRMQRHTYCYFNINR